MFTQLAVFMSDYLLLIQTAKRRDGLEILVIILIVHINQDGDRSDKIVRNLGFL